MKKFKTIATLGICVLTAILTISANSPGIHENEDKLADTLYIKIYSQNHAYQSRNIYKIAKNKNKSTDTLMIYNINIDLEFKNVIDNAETFRVNNFTVDYAIKQHIDNIDKRIIFNKKVR